MKKIISIVFAAILVGLAISCQKEELVSDKTDAVQYTFNITVADQVGFDSDASTKGASGPSYKSVWENGDKIFLFFKPTDGSLLGDRYATLTYNGSSWVGTVTEGQSSLGNGGTLSAVYVYKLDGSVTPTYSDSKWTIATGNTFYNCQTGVDYTVSGSEISASLNLLAPADFVCFSIYETSNGSLTCDKVTGWKDVVIGGEMTFSNATCTGCMTGINSDYGNRNYQDYYGRIVGGGTSLKGVTCKFSVVKGGKVYERTATPSSDKRSFYMNVRTDGTKPWTVAEGKLPGLFTVGKGADGTAGTADDVKVRFSQANLTYDINASTNKWKFYEHQYDCAANGNASSTLISLFTWGYSASTSLNPTGNSYVQDHPNDGDKLVYDKASSEGGDDWGVAYCESNNITVGTWRTLSTDEWKYLFDNHSKKWALVNGMNGYVIAPDNVTLQEDKTSYTETELNEANLVFLPAAGYRDGSNVSDVGVGGSGGCWSSTANASNFAHYVYFNSGSVRHDLNDSRSYGFSVRLISDASATPAPTPANPLYVEIAADYDNDPSTPNTSLKWYRQNLAITTSGDMKWKGDNTSAVKVPGTNEDVKVGDYFQWAAHAGYCGDAAAADKGLLIYNSFINTKCVENTGSDSFDFKSAGGSNKYEFSDSSISPYYSSSAYTHYTDTQHSTLSRETTYSGYNDDVANIILGDNWRMPTSAEFKALKDATYWARDATDCGYYVFAPDAGHTAGTRVSSIPEGLSKEDALLFFPAAGSGSNTYLNDAGFSGFYWSSTLYSSQPVNAYGLDFYSGGINPQSYNRRYYGFSVRPVSD